MFDLKTKDKYEKTRYWLRFSLLMISIIFGIYFFFVTIFFFLNKDANIWITNLIIGQIVAIVVLLANQIFELCKTFYFKKQMTIELLNILKETKMPTMLPKVVFVYTIHNDLWESRLLQSMQQTYQNIEYWISDGSDNPDVIQRAQEFAKKHNINYFSLNRSSIHKADNLNTFLKNSGATFDYLLISDADVAINKNFVSTSIKFFYSKNQIRLGWVSALIQNYKTNNLFTNILLNTENIEFINNFLVKNFQMSMQVNLYSATALIKKEVLEEFNMQFPDSCLEDTWLELLATKKYWTGLINPFAISLQAFDKNIKANHTRKFRINDWTIKYFKSFFFNNQNQMKKEFVTKNFNDAFFGVIYKTIYIITNSCLLVLVILFHKTIFESKIILFLFSFWIAFSVLIFCVYLIKIIPITKWKTIPFVLFAPIYESSKFLYSIYRDIKAIILSKYADFSNSSRSQTNEKSTIIQKLSKFKFFIWTFIIFSILLVITNLSFILTNSYNTNLVCSFFFIFLNINFGLCWLSPVSFFVLYSMSFIKTNRKYNQNDFVYINDKYICQTKTINKWMKENKINVLE